MDNWWDAKPAPYLASGKRIQNGQARAWYPNRQLQYQGQFRDDKPVGRFFWWHENGNRSTVGEFNRAGDRDGRWIWWHDNGMKRIEGVYKNDQPTGVWRTWDRAGKQIKSKDYDSLSGDQMDDQVDPLQGVDPRDEEEMLEGTVKTEPDEASSSNAGFLPNDGSTMEDDGALPLPQDGSEAEDDEPIGTIETIKQGGSSQQPQLESLPPALGVESFNDKSFDDGSATKNSAMRNVGVAQESSVFNRELNNRELNTDSGPVDIRSPSSDVTSTGMETGSALITNDGVNG